MLHQIVHNPQGYSVQTKPKVSDKYHAQFQLDDFDQWIPANDVLPRDISVFVALQYRLDVTNLVLEYDVAQGIANWLSKNN